MDIEKLLKEYAKGLMKACLKGVDYLPFEEKQAILQHVRDLESKIERLEKQLITPDEVDCWGPEGE